MGLCHRSDLSSTVRRNHQAYEHRSFIEDSQSRTSDRFFISIPTLSKARLSENSSLFGAIVRRFPVRLSVGVPSVQCHLYSRPSPSLLHRNKRAIQLYRSFVRRFIAHPARCPCSSQPLDAIGGLIRSSSAPRIAGHINPHPTPHPGRSRDSVSGPLGPRQRRHAAVSGFLRRRPRQRRAGRVGSRGVEQVRTLPKPRRVITLYMVRSYCRVGAYIREV